MCDFILTDSIPVDSASVSLHPRMIRLALGMTNREGQFSIAHFNMTPAEALTLTYQLNETRTAALQPVEEPS